MAFNNKGSLNVDYKTEGSTASYNDYAAVYINSKVQQLGTDITITAEDTGNQYITGIASFADTAGGNLDLKVTSNTQADLDSSFIPWANGVVQDSYAISFDKANLAVTSHAGNANGWRIYMNSSGEAAINIDDLTIKAVNDYTAYSDDDLYVMNPNAQAITIGVDPYAGGTFKTTFRGSSLNLTAHGYNAYGIEDLDAYDLEFTADYQQAVITADAKEDTYGISLVDSDAALTFSENLTIEAAGGGSVCGIDAADTALTTGNTLIQAVKKEELGKAGA